MPLTLKGSVVVSGGGTGGHFFAAQSFIELLKKEGYQVTFIGSSYGIENKLTKDLSVNFKLFNIRGFAGKNFVYKFKSLWLLVSSTFQCLKILHKEKPKFVIGFGGYTTLPVIISAFLIGIKRVIVEQNSIPGVANKVLSKISNIIFVNFDETKKFFTHRNVYVVGNPIRVMNFPRTRVFSDKTLRIGIMGGSKGAKSINKALFEFAQIMDDELKKKIIIIHQTGVEDYQKAIDIYKKYNINAKVYDFIKDIENFYSNIDLIISRAGASALSEIACFGIPAILVPYPYAIYDHQYHNAKIFEKSSCAKLITDKNFNGYSLKNFIYYIKVDELKRMSENAFGLCKKDSRSLILKIIKEELVSNGKSN